MWLKVVEVGVLVVAGVAFVVWQLWDVRRAREAADRERSKAQAVTFESDER